MKRSRGRGELWGGGEGVRGRGSLEGKVEVRNSKVKLMWVGGGCVGTDDYRESLS